MLVDILKDQLKNIYTFTYPTKHALDTGLVEFRKLWSKAVPGPAEVCLHT